MTFLRTIPPEEATGKLRELYDEDVKTGGRARTSRTLGLRPEAAAAVNVFGKELRSSLKSTMTPRNYALVGFVASLWVGCSA